MAKLRTRPRGEQGAGEVRELEITAVGAQGDGLAGRVFAPLTLPGERVTARVTR